MWNPWHGCRKYSSGCEHCYVFRGDARHGLDAALVYKTRNFDLPVRRKKNGDYLHPAGTFFWTCFTSDFLLDTCDEWRREAWALIRERADCRFLFITKRIERFRVGLPPDWGTGYQHVTVCLTCEDQQAADRRLPVFLDLPLQHRVIVLEPLLGPVNLGAYLGPGIEEVVVGGESGPRARPCDFAWILAVREQCLAAGIAFSFRQTGANFIKDGRFYRVPRRLQHLQAAKAGLNFKSNYTPEAL